MQGTASEILTESFGVVASAIGAVAVTIAGLLAEQAGLQNVLGGQLTVGMWEVGAGALLLFAGVYMLGYNEFWYRLRGLRQAD